MQLTHYNTKFARKSHPITLVCENISKAYNVGGLFRIADAFGINELIFCGEHYPIGKRALRSSRHTEKFVSYRTQMDIQSVLLNFIPTHTIIALEITDQSRPLRKLQFDVHKPLVLVLGNENYGISESVLSRCNNTAHIEMYGANSSMNVVQAAGIALYDITNRLK